MALCVAMMLSAIIFVSADIDNSTYASLSAEGWEFHMIDSFVELNEMVSDSSFANFVDTFSGLAGSFGELVEFSGMMTDSRAEFADETASYARMLIQLEALYTLYTSGVRNADRWIEDTTIDLSGYEDVWVRVNFETGEESYVNATEAGF